MGDMPWTRQYRVPTEDELALLEQRRRRRKRLAAEREARKRKK